MPDPSPDTSQNLLFIEVPDAKRVKNRIHLHLRPQKGSRDEELQRLRDLGATEVADRRDIHPPAPAWTRPADHRTSSSGRFSWRGPTLRRRGSCR